MIQGRRAVTISSGPTAVTNAGHHQLLGSCCERCVCKCLQPWSPEQEDKGTAYSKATLAMTCPLHSPLPPSLGVWIWEVQPEHGGKLTGSPAAPCTTVDLHVGMQALRLNPTSPGMNPFSCQHSSSPRQLCRQYFLQAGLFAGRGMPSMLLPPLHMAATQHTVGPIRVRGRQHALGKAKTLISSLHQIRH